MIANHTSHRFVSPTRKQGTALSLACASGSQTSMHVRRMGFTLPEVMISLVVLAGAAVLVAQLAAWSLTERARTDARLEAVDAATNVLERARAREWNDLTGEWASGQKLPELLIARWPDCRLTVKVEPEASRPSVKRVTVEVKWTGDRSKWPPVALTGLFASHATEAKK